jgi:hypothetical protein
VQSCGNTMLHIAPQCNTARAPRFLLDRRSHESGSNGAYAQVSVAAR